MGMLRRFGWLPDPPSPKDHDAAPKLRTAGPLPTSISLANQILSILDQGNLGSCVAQATAQALRASLVHQGVVVPTLASRSIKNRETKGMIKLLPCFPMYSYTSRAPSRPS